MKTRCPCEVIIWYVLPKLRAQISRELVNLGFTQQEAAQKLGITQAAVSQYLSNKRGNSKYFKGKIQRDLAKISREIAEGKRGGGTTSLCELCQEVRESKIICKIHREHEEVPSDCVKCFEEFSQYHN